jgi:hypothetical protein
VRSQNGAIVAWDGKSFLCTWFVTPVAGYAKQFVKYGAARALGSPEEIACIPEMLGGFDITPQVQHKMWCPIKAARLESLLQGA